MVQERTLTSTSRSSAAQFPGWWSSMSMVKKVQRSSAKIYRPNCYQYTSSKSKFHAFYAHPGRRVAPAVRIAPEVDVRGDGSEVVFAPQTHASGAVYTLYYLQCFTGWESLIPCPDLGQLKPPQEKPTRDAATTLDAPDGARNQTLTQFVGKLYAKDRLGMRLCASVTVGTKSTASPLLPEK